MGRRVVTAQYQRNTTPGVDGYFDKLIKYIPSDIVAAWVAVSGMVKSATDINAPVVMWISLVIGVGLTALWTWKQTNVTGSSPAAKQIAISTVAFVVWAIALGPPFDSIGFYHPLYGALILVAYTLFVGLLDP